MRKISDNFYFSEIYIGRFSAQKPVASGIFSILFSRKVDSVHTNAI